MHRLDGPHGRSGRARLSDAQRHEPFTPRLPRSVRERPALFGLCLAVIGVAGAWYISRHMQDWPDWMVFPAMLLSVLALASMMIGLGLLTVLALEPVIGKIGFNWDDDPVATLGLPPALQRKCEQLGFWTANGIVKALAEGSFPWTALEYDERMQLDRAAQRWRQTAADGADGATRRRAHDGNQQERAGD